MSAAGDSGWRLLYDPRTAGGTPAHRTTGCGGGCLAPVGQLTGS
jgi:hypothetical protein